MKIQGDKIKLGPNDYRAGNFIFHREPEFWKICDLGQTFFVRVSAHITAGKVIEMLVRQIREGVETARPFLQGYAAVMFNFLCSVPDAQLLQEVNKLCLESYERHKEVYGVGQPSEEADKEAIEEVKTMMEVEEKAKKEIQKEEDKA